jgi:hypothetical protein
LNELPLLSTTLTAASDGLMAELPKLTQKASNDAVKLAAIKDALDRTGLGANQTMRLELEASFGAILENYDGVAWTADVDDKEAEIAELKAELARPRRYDGATLTDGHEDEEPLTGEVVYHLREGRYPLVRRRNVRHRRATRQPEAVRASPVPAPLGTLVPTGKRTPTSLAYVLCRREGCAAFIRPH